MTERPIRYVIIGNGAAGTTAAETLRKQDSTSHVTLIAGEPYALYNRVSLPPFLKLQATEQKVMMRTPEQQRALGIDLRLSTWVRQVDTEAKVVFTDQGTEFYYDKLLTLRGGTPRQSQVPGAQNCQHVYYFQTLDDAKAISDAATRAKSIVTVGGSYISYELTDAFAIRHVPVTWIMRGPRFLHRTIDEEGGALVDDIARAHDVQVIHGEELREISRSNGSVTGVVTQSGRTIDADVVCCGLGLSMYIDFLRDTPIALETGVLANEFLETSVPDVYAAGDVAEFFDLSIGSRHRLGTWANAIAHGRRAALNMLGKREPFIDVPVYTSTLFDTKMSVIGLTGEEQGNLETVQRCDRSERTYRRLFFREDCLVGGAFIGELKGRAKLLNLIKSRQPVEGSKKALLDTM
ncbi:MAG: FAD-dependent oxidoreductase [Chloroflexi bacterium]|nr:FAD-dependent oxidoreductase [Chloroflexota bacterium]